MIYAFMVSKCYPTVGQTYIISFEVAQQHYFAAIPQKLLKNQVTLIVGEILHSGKT